MNLVERNDAIERRWYCRICLWWMFNEQVSWHARQFNSDSSKIVGSRIEHVRCEIFNRIFHFGFRHVNLRATKPSQNSTWILTEIRGQFLRMNPYWICAHLNLVKIRHKSLLNLWTIFAHESLLNLRASKPTQNSTWILTEICGQFLRMNPYWICAHLKLVKIWHKSLLEFVDNFCAWILTEFARI